MDKKNVLIYQFLHISPHLPFMHPYLVSIWNGIKTKERNEESTSKWIVF